MLFGADFGPAARSVSRPGRPPHPKPAKNCPLTHRTALWYYPAMKRSSTSPASSSPSGTCETSSIDSVKVDPIHHKVEFENAQVRVIRWVVPPRDKTLNHSHQNNVNVCLTDYNGKVTTPDGKTREDHFKAGSTAWRESGAHLVENISSQLMTGIIVEPKRPASARPAGAQDVMTADPKHNKTIFENKQVRVIRESWGAGEKSQMHGHPDSVLVLLTDLKVNMTAADGKTTPYAGKAGEVRWCPAAQHVVENTGDKGLEQIVIEMKGVPTGKAGGK
jgi:quercetin dioxygenase-like cupin family protein